MSKTKRRRIQRDPQIQKRHRERFLARGILSTMTVPALMSHWKHRRVLL
jgi:hypothetical protein